MAFAISTAMKSWEDEHDLSDIKEDKLKGKRTNLQHSRFFFFFFFCLDTEAVSEIMEIIILLVVYINILLLIGQTTGRVLELLEAVGKPY